jgi:nucleoid-associated protein YgaU
MRIFLALGTLCAAVLPGMWAAEESFSQAVRAEDFSAAGLAKLSPAELARLDALVRDYKSGALLAARREAAAAERARAAAEARAAKAAAEAQAAQAAAEARAAQLAAAAEAAKQAAAKAEAKKSEGGLLARAKALLPAGTEVEYAAVESRIVGEFTGWEARTVFTLENGQRWQVANRDEGYFCPPIKNPAVKITPGALNSFWLVIEGVKPRVKVVRVDSGR